MLTFEEVNELLEYAPELSGSCLRWRCSKGTAKEGRKAGTTDYKGYYNVKINRKYYKAHRLVWLLCTGAWPKDQLDHIDRNKGNTNINNLRECTRAENHQNRDRQANNTSGYTGVSREVKGKKWRARIKLDGTDKYIGCYNTPEEAYEAYKKAKAELHTFHPEASE